MAPAYEHVACQCDAPEPLRCRDGVPAAVTPTIVILAYERPDALRRLLASIERALYPPDAAVSLVISLDRAQRPQGRETLAVARSFDWQHGPKTVLEHDQHLGVVGHFRAAGALARDYGDVILLEDDLTVAPPFYDFASQVLDRYRDDERIAGTCLYGLWFNGFTLEPFTPIDDGGDVFFLGVPHTQGLCFSAGIHVEGDDQGAGHSHLRRLRAIA